MGTASKRIGIEIAAAALAGLFLLVPLLIHAQTTSSAALSATIRAAILEDPRSAGLSSAQIDAMVSALAGKAQTQGVTAQDIAYRPGTPGIAVPGVTTGNNLSASDPCSLSSSCEIGRFLGSGLARNATYAAFWILSLLLIVVVWRMRKHPHLNGSIEKPEIPAIGTL